MHTEKQARELWCPLVRHEGDAGGTFNRGWSTRNPTNKSDGLEQSYECNCISSACAAWRWSEAVPGKEKTGHCGNFSAPIDYHERLAIVAAREGVQQLLHRVKSTD